MKKINNVDMNGKTYAIAIIVGAIIYEIVKRLGWVDTYTMIVPFLLSAFVLFESYVISRRLYKGFKNNVWEVTLHTNRKLDTFMRWLWIVVGLLLLTETKLIESIIGVGFLYTSIATFYLKKKCEEEI
jgi:Na+-translocating ferredoxin:NAD+ oxidoreductase RnfD subunit|tara:strand:+ start:1712 stop:2095 length:384 start_codon:yes stop_codon:yes gene_type:complete